MITQQNPPYTTDEIKAMVKTIEDLRKKYNKALERARALNDEKDVDIEAGTTICEYIFPELKEDTNDERVRKGLIKAVSRIFEGHKLFDTDVTREEALDWLEKQEEPEDKGEISDGYHTFNELYWYRTLYNAAFFNMLPKEIVHKSKRHHDGEECFGGGWFIVMANLPTGQISNHYELKDWDLFQIPEKEIADKWDGHTPQESAERLHKYLLEKQGEKKHIINVPPREVILSIWDLGNEWKELTNGCISTEYGTQLNYIQKHWHESEYYLKEKQGKQTQLDYEHANIPQKDFAPFEPKFKVGDWIVQENIGTYKIIEVCESWYEVIDNQNNRYSIGFDKEHMCHLWSINDAKDGDVLATENFIFIFKNIDDGNGVHYYCQYEISKHEDDNQFDIALPQSLMGRVGNSISHYSPATKEQRDLLFSKMKQEGYEWKQEEKKLIKINEPNHVWNEEDEEMLTWLCRIIHSQRLDRAITLKEESELGKWIDKWLNYNPQTKQSEQPTNKIKPKFKEGDYIVPYNTTPLEIWKVVNIDKDGYYNVQPITNIINIEDDETYRVPGFIIEKDYRLWTIDDAKNGDVLVNGSNIFIFHFINDTRLMGYCHVNIDNGRFYDDIGKNECFCLIDAIVTPATKEQRELLFAKMKQEGYEWDAENKRLNKQSLKITPKFCVGQLITDDNGTWYRITNIKCLDDWYYEVYDACEDNTHHELCSIIDKKFRKNRFVDEIKKMIGD